MPSNPWVMAEFRLAKFPASEGTRLLRWSTRTRSLGSRLYEPRLLAVGELTRMASDEDANLVVGNLTLTLDDEDGELGALLDEGTTTEYWTQREVDLWAISEQGIAAGLTPDDVPPEFRGFVTDVQRDPTNGRVVTVTVADALGSQMSGFNLKKKCLSIRLRDLNPNLPPDIGDKALRLLCGEFSDIGATSAGGSSAEKGLVSVDEIDQVNITGGAGPTYAAPPVITASSVTGATGQEPIWYAATVITPYGESSLSNVVMLDGASRANRNLSNYNQISGTFDPGPDPLNPYKVRIWVGTSATNIIGWLDEANYNGAGVFGYDDGAGPWPAPSRDELDDVKHQSPPDGNQAQTNTGIFSRFAVCLGYGYELLKIEWSDLAEETEPKRVPTTEDEHGSSIITPEDEEWPYDVPYFETNGIRWFGFLARGPKVQHHRDKVVTIAVSVCGPHIDGKAINQAFPALQFVLNEHALKNKGSGYTNGDYGTLETFANGDSIIKTEDFAACQETTKAWLGTELGYLAAIFVDDTETTWRDVIRDFCKTFGASVYPSRFSQIGAMLIPTSPDGVAGRHWRERLEIKRSEGERLAWELVLNRIVGSYFWDLDAQDFRAKSVPVDNLTSQAAHVPGGVVGTTDTRGLQEEIRECPFTNDRATFLDVLNRDLVRRARRPRYMSKCLALPGMDHDIGTRGRVTDRSGIGPAGVGDSQTTVLVIGRTNRFLEDEVVLHLRDMRAITGGAGPVGSEADDSAAPLGSEAAGTAQEIR